MWSLKRILQISPSTTKERDRIRREGGRDDKNPREQCSLRENRKGVTVIREQWSTCRRLFIALIQTGDVCGLSNLYETETGSRQLWNVNPLLSVEFHVKTQ